MPVLIVLVYWINVHTNSFDAELQLDYLIEVSSFNSVDASLEHTTKPK